MPFKPRGGRKNFRGNSRGNFREHSRGNFRGRGRGRGYGRDGQQNNAKKREYRFHEQLSEEDVGITEFINTSEGFTGVIKARFSDFQVNEINLSGVVAKLTDRSFPHDFRSKLQEFDYREVSESPISEIPQEKWDEMRALLQNTDDICDGNFVHPKIIELNVAEFDKECRKKIHECIKKHFGLKLIANTKHIDQKLVMEIKKFSKGDPQNQRQSWPQDKGEFVHFLVYKEMMDTMETSLIIAEKLKLKPSLISYAGVKDRRAKTTQWMCIKKVEPHKLLSKTNGIRNISVGNLEFKDKALKIGDLSGNKFRIAIRNVLAEDEAINKSLEYIKEHGFINYYGLQRFGNDKEVPTYLIGTKLLTNQWKEAVDLILKIKPSDDPDLDLTKAKKIFNETSSAIDALKLLDNRSKTLEAKLLEGILKNGNSDYVNSLENIPRNTRLMYIHSFQSIVWNQMASKRVKEFGFEPVEGDLVLVEESTDGIDPELLIDKDEKDEEDKSDATESDDAAENTESKKDDAECKKNDAESKKDDTESKKTNEESKKDNEKESKEEKPKIRQQVKVLGKEDLKNYTIYDIVLPLPGYDIQYPENLKTFYKETVEHYGLTLEMPQQRVRTYNLSGAYRKLMGKPTDMSWKMMHFNDPARSLIRSDLEELKDEKEPQSVENGKFKALVLEFNLKPSSYATMVLREAMKCSTSVSRQAQQNYYAETKPPEKPNKVIMDDEKKDSKKEENVEADVPSASLLADKAKYESFMNSILGDASEVGENENVESGEKTNQDSLKRNIESVNVDEPVNKKHKSIEENDKASKNLTGE